jgi:predicted nucleotidyltransferase
MDATSDVDVLVEFERPVGAFELMDVQDMLTDELGRRVELVTPAAVRPWMRERIEREAVRVT